MSSVCRGNLHFRDCPERLLPDQRWVCRGRQERKALSTTQHKATGIYFVSGIFILYPFTFSLRLLKNIKWCRLFSQCELQIGSRQLCLIYIFQSGKKKKSRLISLTDSGCPGYFLFIKVKLPLVAAGVLAYVLKYCYWGQKGETANCCPQAGGARPGAHVNSPFRAFSFVSAFSCHR